MTSYEIPRYCMAVDCVIFGYAKDNVYVALIKRKNPPFVGSWALPGGFVEEKETVEQAALRELEEETGIHDVYLEQFHVFSELCRDPRQRVISVGFFALISYEDVTLLATEDAIQARWFPMYAIPHLAFDHEAIYAKAIDALRNTIATRPLIFDLLPKEFTLGELQNIYQQIFDIKLDKRNFRKKILKIGFIQETQKITKGQKCRPAKLYRFNKKRYLEAKATNLLPTKQIL